MSKITSTSNKLWGWRRNGDDFHSTRSWPIVAYRCRKLKKGLGPLIAILSVHNGPGPRQGPAGGLPRAPDKTGRQKAVCPRPYTRRKAVIMKDDEHYDVRQFQVEGGRGWWRAPKDGGGWRKTAENSGRRPKTARDGKGRPGKVGTAGDDKMSSVLVLRSYLSGKFRKRRNWTTQSRPS